MESIEVFKKSFNEGLFILPLGDIHFDADCNVERLLKDVEYIQKNGFYTLLIGDLFDVGFFNQVRTMEEKEQTLNSAMRSLKEIFTPIKDKILCVVEGNHDRRISKATGFDIVEEFTDDLGIPYARGQAVLDLRIGQRDPSNPRVGKYEYSVAISHGYGGGRTYGAKANKITHWADTWEGIDLFVIGHVHSPMSIPKARYVFDRRTGSVKISEIRSVVLGAYQEEALYAVQSLYPPSARINYLVYLSGNEKKITISEVSQ